MFQSLKYSNLALRLSLGFVFLWFGIDKFLHPDYWINAWVPQSVTDLVGTFRLRPTDIIYISGVFEVLVGISLVTNIFIVLFSSLSILFLLNIMVFHGFSSEVLVRDIGLVGGLLALVFWPKQRFH